jgi:hypothetical protein
MKCSDNFEIEELVPDTIFNNYHNNSIQFIDERLITLLECLRKHLKTELIINTWNFTSEQLTTLNSKYGTNYDINNRFTTRGYIIPAISANDQITQQMAGRACIFDAIGISNTDVLTLIQQNWLQYKMYGLSNVQLQGTSIYIDVRFMRPDWQQPYSLTILPAI